MPRMPGVSLKKFPGSTVKRTSRYAAIFFLTGKPCHTIPFPLIRISFPNGWRPSTKYTTDVAMFSSFRHHRPVAYRTTFLSGCPHVSFEQGETLDEEKLRAQLTIAGYNHVSQVMSPGEYSVRGGLIDLFHGIEPALPHRSLRGYDRNHPHVRRRHPASLYPVREIRMLPGREFPMDEQSRAFFRSRWREVFEGDPTLSVIYRDIASGIASAGIKYTCRFSSRKRPHFSTIFPKTPFSHSSAIPAKPSSDSGPIRSHGIISSNPTGNNRCCPGKTVFKQRGLLFRSGATFRPVGHHF